MGNYQQVSLSSGNLKRWGRQALEGNWLTAVLGTLLFIVLTSGPLMVFTLIFDHQALERTSDFYTFLVGGSLNLGFITLMISIFRREKPSPLTVLYGFEHFLKALLLLLVVNIFVALWTMLFVIPGIIAAYRYSMAFYILADNPQMGVFEVIAESKKMMAGNKMKFFLLQLSFIGWAILSMATLGIGFIWLLPYASASFVGFYEIARGSLNQGPTAIPEITKEGVEL